MRRRPVNLTNFTTGLEMESQTSANQLLPQIAGLTGIDLRARIIEVLIFNKRAELRSPIVICAGNNLPREVGMTLPSTSVDGDSAGYGVYDLDPRRFRVVNAKAAAGIRLESSKRESQDKVPHKRASVNPGRHVPLCQYITKGIAQREVSAPSKAVIKEVTFNGRPDYACEKDVTEFDAAKETDVIFRVDSESVSEAR